MAYQATAATDSGLTGLSRILSIRRDGSTNDHRRRKPRRMNTLLDADPYLGWVNGAMTSTARLLGGRSYFVVGRFHGEERPDELLTPLALVEGCSAQLIDRRRGRLPANLPPAS